jgi:hypothetical protein
MGGDWGTIEHHLFISFSFSCQIAHSQRLPCIEWCVLRTNYGALGFYDNLPGIEDLTDRKEANKSICWRWEKPQWAQVQRKAKPVKKIEVNL